MRSIPIKTAETAERLLSSPDGQLLLQHLVQEYGLMERSFLADSQGKVSPINAAIRDGERGVVGYLFKLSRGEFSNNPTHEARNHNPR